MALQVRCTEVLDAEQGRSQPLRPKMQRQQTDVWHLSLLKSASYSFPGVNATASRDRLFFCGVRLVAGKPHQALRSLPKLDHIQHKLGQCGDLIKKLLVVNGLFKMDQESASRIKRFLNQVPTFYHVAKGGWVQRGSYPGILGASGSSREE